MSKVSASANSVPGIGLGRKILLTDVEAAKKNELDRRRKLRIQQVRQQANEIANNVRAKIQCKISKEKSNAAKEKDSFLKQWECRKVNDLQTKYQECLKNVGQAHTQAAAQPDINEFLSLRRQIDDACANIRGRHASDLLRHELQRLNEQQDAGIRKKKAVREKEDLRATLVASLPPPCPTVPVKKVQSLSSCQNRSHAATKRSSPFKKQKLIVKKDRQRPRVLQDIPTNLPSSSAPVLQHDDLVINNECISRVSPDTNDAASDGDAFEERNNDCSCTHQECNCNEDDDLLHSAGGADMNKYSEDNNSNNLFTNVTKKDIIRSSRPSARVTVKTKSSKNTGPNSTNTIYSLNRNIQVGNNMSSSNRSQCTDTNKIDHRRRRYSDSMDVYSDDGFDSDVTWPPSSIPRQHTNANLKDLSSPTVRTTKHYDHNNRFFSVRSRSKPDVSVTRLHHLPDNGQSIEAERKVIEEKASKMHLLCDRQARRGMRAMRKQRVVTDFQHLINDLKTLDRKERQLRCSTMRPEMHVDIIGETMRQEKLKNDQKKMEMIIEKAGGLQSALGESIIVPDTGNDDHSLIDEICGSEQIETPKLNVAECRPDMRRANVASKAKEPSGTGFTNPNSSRLTLQNLMKRINEQREQLYSELKNDSYNKDIIKSLIAEDEHEVDKSSKKSTVPTWAQDIPTYRPNEREPSLKAQERYGSLPEYKSNDSDIKPHSQMSYRQLDEKLTTGKEDKLEPCDSIRTDNNQQKQEMREIADTNETSQDHSAHVHVKNICVYSKIECDDKSPNSKGIFQSDSIRRADDEEGLRSSSPHPKDTSTQERTAKRLQKNQLSQFEDEGLNEQKIVPVTQMSKVNERSPSPNTRCVDRIDKNEGQNSSNLNDNAFNFNSSTDRACKHVIRQSTEQFISTANKNGDSSESGTTLYSLDMALSQLSMDSSFDSPNNSFRGVKIVVKVSGQSSKNKDGKKHKRHKEECSKKLTGQHEKVKEELEKKVAQKKEESAGVAAVEKTIPGKSNGSSSTSYLSPPDHLTPKQITMLSELLKGIENKNDKGIPLLKYYIQKLLAMTRESVDRLGVSSSDVSIHSSLFEDDNFHDSSRQTCQSDAQPRSSAIRDDLYDEAIIRQNLEILRRQMNQKNDLKQIDTNAIIDKYTELAKRYADRISSLAEMIGDTAVSEKIKKSVCGQDNGYIDDETTYLSLPPETNVKVPVGKIGPCEYVSQTFDEDCSRIHHTSWHDKLSCVDNGNVLEKIPGYELPKEGSAFVGVSSRISPSPPRSSSQKQRQYPCQSPVSAAPAGTKPPPTILNCKTRMCTPHELSTIQEVDTPSTSHVPLSQKRSPRKPCGPCGRMYDYDDFQIPLDDPKIEDVNLTFLSINSQTDNSQSDECEISNEVLSSDSYPDIMNELLRRGILTSPFEWAKEKEDACGAEKHNTNSTRQNNSSGAWVKDRLCSFLEDPSSSQMADEEVRGILKESSPEDIEAAFDSMGLGWASTTLRKTRRATEFNDNSSSNGECPRRSTRSKLGRGTSTPDGSKMNKTGDRSCRLIPNSESDISTVKHMSQSDLALRLTPPNLSLQPGSLRFTTLSDESLGSFS